jgi:hypothetical protein
LAKLEFGKKVSKTSLPEAVADGSDRVVVSVYSVQELPEEVVAAQQAAEEKMLDAIVVPSELTSRLHHVASATRQALKAAKADHEQFFKTEPGLGVVSAQVGKSHFPLAPIAFSAETASIGRRSHSSQNAAYPLTESLDFKSFKIESLKSYEGFEISWRQAPPVLAKRWAAGSRGSGRRAAVSPPAGASDARVSRRMRRDVGVVSIFF